MDFDAFEFSYNKFRNSIISIIFFMKIFEIKLQNLNIY